MRNFGKLGRLNFEKKPILGKVTENKKSSECKIKINQTGLRLQPNIFLSSVNMYVTRFYSVEKQIRNH